MARNIEIKAHIPSVAALLERAAALADQGPTEIRQDDTFFECRSGRLKLRTFANGEGELIFYRRTDEHGPKESFTFEHLPPRPTLFVRLSRWPTVWWGEFGKTVRYS